MKQSFVFWILIALIQPLHSWSQSATQKSKNISKDEIALFSELLDYFKKYPQVQIELGGGIYKFPEVDRVLLGRLSPEVLGSRIRQFNNDFKSYKASEVVLEKQLKSLDEDIKKMPISDTQNRSLQELKIESTRSKVNQNRKVMVMLSIQANESFIKAVSTLSQKDLKVEQVVEKPKMPGVFGGSAMDRQRMEELDKLNLTPVDPEFYDSQLGKKLEKDLGGRADFWSYDYAQDELYVKVNNELGKLRIFKDTSGTRFIRTRAGTEFLDPRGKDEPVDMLNAKGKFLTGNGGEENLFGEFPNNAPKLLDENKIKHNKPTDHNDHNH